MIDRPSPSAQTLDEATNQQQRKIDYEAALRTFNLLHYALVVILLGIIISRSVAAADGDLTTGTIILYSLSYGLWWICVIIGICAARHKKQELLIVYQFGLGLVLTFEIIGDIYAFKKHTSKFPDAFIICLMVLQIIMMTFNILRARNLRLLMIALLHQKINSNVDIAVK